LRFEIKAKFEILWRCKGHGAWSYSLLNVLLYY
jgi:hypothetical protein